MSGRTAVAGGSGYSGVNAVLKLRRISRFAHISQLETAVPYATDLELSAKDVSSLSSADAVAGFFTTLGYPTGVRQQLTPSALGLTGDTAQAVRAVELLAADEDGILRVVFARVRSITAKVRNELARKLGQTGSDHLIVLASDFDVLEFVLVDKRSRQHRGPAGTGAPQIIPRTVSVNRKANTQLDRRMLRRLTWTGTDGLDQFEKLRSVFESATFASHYFQNRALFSDHYLHERLPEDDAWRDNPAEPFTRTKELLRDARQRWTGKDERVVRGELFEPIWKILGFKARANKQADQDHLEPDYRLACGGGKSHTSAFVYRWDRWLDGPDYNDPDTPEENPGAAVVSALANGNANWAIVTNGKLWRLYSREAHSRSTNFYEVDLEEALAASQETDPNEAFRYWWLFFRPEAFQPIDGDDDKRCWLDTIVRGSRDYAKRLGERLKDRVFTEIFPHLAKGFLEYRKQQSDQRTPTEAELTDTFEATLTLLYRLLFLLYAEARDLLPIGESPYHAASLKKIKEEIAEHGGRAVDDVPERLRQAYTKSGTQLYDRLARLFLVMDQGDASLNVPCYNGGLFITEPQDDESREHRIARFLADNKVPDYYLALAIDRLARDEDEKPVPGATGQGAKLPHGLVFIDYKSLEVRHLGSIYEGLLEFKLKVAAEDLATRTEKKREKYVPLSQAKPRRGTRRSTGGDAGATPVVHQGDVYLSNDKAERKATGSYYTPDPIVEYIVEHTVGPVLAEKLEALRADLNAAGKTYHRHVTNARNNPGLLSKGGAGVSPVDMRAFAASKTYAEHRDLVDRVFDLKVLDPAMGSGHFLVEAVDFITDRLLDFLNRFPNNPVNFALNRTRENILRSLGEQGVTVDADKLTDVNLLKRHVLKRCIYGVDLNPMAVELAKVSLWLDAFTLGAPLSFLDHHLRCGNSLIGATFEDLEKATTGQLFAIDYEPLLRAIRHVLFVNEMADATAAEVHQSADEYSQARKELSGYQIVLDLLVADHFMASQPSPLPGGTTGGSRRGRARAAAATSFKPSDLLRQASDLDLTTRAKLLTSLDEKATLLVEQVENVARRPDLRFFHWEIEFPEVFFGFADVDRRQIKHRNDIAAGSAGFDAVVGNPPYDVLSSKELGIDLTALQAYIAAEPSFAPARRGKQNLYKLFTCRGFGLLAHHARIGHIVPMTILGDDQAAGVRHEIIAAGAFTAIEAFPQEDDPRRRVFPDAKMCTSIFIATRRKDLQAVYARARRHPANLILDSSPTLHFRSKDISLYDPENAAVICCSQEDWDLAVRIMGTGRLIRMGQVAEFFQGEVNETIQRGAGTLAEPGAGKLVTRGACVCLYVTRDASQGSDLYLDVARFLADSRPESKAWHHRLSRVVLQELASRSNVRRVIAAMLGSNEFCNHTINYCPAPRAKVDLEIILAVLNSRLIEWYFRLGSTNAHVSQYQLRNLPFPVFAASVPTPARLIEQFRRAVETGNWAEAQLVVNPLLAEPPFAAPLMQCMKLLTLTIIDIESGRGQIGRTERSALDPHAQPLQDLLDHMIYRMAGLTDDDIAGLEERLARML